MSGKRKRALERGAKIDLAFQALSVIPKPSVSSIARKFGISPSTLQFRVNGGQNRVAAHEDQMPVKLIQEAMLANWILRSSFEGRPVSRRQLIGFAAEIAIANGYENKLPPYWVKKSIARSYGKALREDEVSPEDTWSIEETGLKTGQGSNEMGAIELPKLRKASNGKQCDEARIIDNVGKTTSSQLTKAMNPLDPETPPNECLTIEFTSPKKPKEAYKSLARLTDQTLSPRTRAEHSWNICRFMEKQVTEI
ncbi:uncharacterized protein J8A68_003841 [[Candida] subhashii]|uniref:HTH psq-type domain-containing protein n=1 Tax=[Candida] subhashii TaxID=561895 RepID=A0A8J5QLG0_9ASCO|nr:uncharacterized protein J8A68_003841 [[Candida] subhashii]KAG7662633.1 hypothetical protein J8A68_003841 [[Candida] subhashii]